jgi:hypothetical protein
MKTIAILPFALGAVLSVAACSSKSTNVTTTNEVATDLNSSDLELNAADDGALNEASNASELGVETVNNG